MTKRWVPRGVSADLAYHQSMSSGKLALPRWFRHPPDEDFSFYCIFVNTTHGFGFETRSTAPVAGVSTWVASWLRNHPRYFTELDLVSPVTALY